MNKNSKRKAVLVRRNIRAEGGGANINSSVERAKGVTRSGAPRKPWRGGGDPLKRGKVNYSFSTPSPYESRETLKGLRATVVVLDYIAQPKINSAPRHVVDLIGATKKAVQ